MRPNRRYKRRTCTLPTILLLVLPGFCAAQPDMSDFNPDMELRRLAAMPGGYSRVQRYFYLGQLTTSSGRMDVAREAYRQALATYDDLDGDHRTLAVAYAAQSALGLAGITHVAFRDAPLRWESYREDSLKRWGLLMDVRDEYNRVTTIGYARATFEALFLRASVLEEWDKGDLDREAEGRQGVEPVVRGIRHLQTAIQLNEQAKQEYRRVVTLSDSLGLAGATGDDDVSRWTVAARDREAALDGTRAEFRAREDALQIVYAERQSAIWYERALPLLWRRGREIAERDAGTADPFLDYYLRTKLADNAFRPFLFGEDGFLTAHRRALESARRVRSDEWVNARLRWERRQEWNDTEISRRLALEGLTQLSRVPGTLDTVAVRLEAAADSLPAEWMAALTRPPEAPELDMPGVPAFGGVDPRLLSPVEAKEQLDEFYRFTERMTDVIRQVRDFQDMVRSYEQTARRVEDADQPPEVEAFKQRRRSLVAANVLLLDTLMTLVLDPARRALDDSRSAAVWMPSGSESVTSQQSIATYAGAVGGQLRALAVDARTQAERFRARAGRLNRRPPALDLLWASGKLGQFATILDKEAEYFSPSLSGS